MSRIKRLEEFQEINEDFSLNGILSSILPALGSGFTKTIKQKIVASLMETIGIKPDSVLSVLLQEFVDQLPVADIPGIITGEKGGAEYFAPKLAAFVQETVQRKGMDTFAEKLGIDPNSGWLYPILRETLQTQIGKENLTKFFLTLFNASKTNVGKSAVELLDPYHKEKLASELNKKMDDKKTEPGKEEESFLGNLLSGMMGQSSWHNK